jgi:hypothetical protein
MRNEAIIASGIVKTSERRNIDRVLECAVVATWADLMRGAQTGLIHIEYRFAAGGTLDFLQVWSSLTRGHWLLACSWWSSASAFHAAGVRFENGYQSEALARILQFVMQHQNAFVLPPQLGRKGMLQIVTPTKEDVAAAAELINEAFAPLDSPLALLGDA